MRTRYQCVLWGLLIGAIAVPQTALAISGCSTGALRGIYNTQVSNLGLQTFLKSLNSSGGSSGDAAAGLTANANSLIGNQPGVGRYYFDGTGNIAGVSTGSRPVNIVVGRYTVNADCTGRITMNSGAAFDLVIIDGGKRVLSVRTDSGGAGNLGTLTHAGSCGLGSTPASYGFSFSGASGDATKSGPYSAIGALTLLGNGSFTMNRTVYSGGKVDRSTSNGTYSLSSDCILTLRFASNDQAAPVGMVGLIVDGSGGFVTLQPDKNSMITGTLQAQ